MMSFFVNVIKYLVLPITLAVAFWYVTYSDSERYICRVDYGRGEEMVCRPRCPYGEFSLPGMDACRKWLTCRDIESADFQMHEAIGGGAVKNVYRATWKGHTVIYNHLARKEYGPDYRHGLQMLRAYQPSPHVTQLLGYCKDKHVTEFHRFSSADKLEELLTSPLYAGYNTVSTRFAACVSYIRAVEFLHRPSLPETGVGESNTGAGNSDNSNSTSSAPAPRDLYQRLGTRVMCDSNDVTKTLQQFLLTDDFQLVLNDLDALPRVNRSAGQLIKCGHRELFGDFVAPEQLWPYPEREFDDHTMPPYDEKTDIWKIPDVCEALLGRGIIGTDPIRFKLFRIDQACKNTDPAKRPNATQVLDEYLKVQEEYDLL